MRQREPPRLVDGTFFMLFIPFLTKNTYPQKIMSGHIIRKETVSAKKTGSFLYVPVYILISNNVKGGNCYV